MDLKHPIFLRMSSTSSQHPQTVPSSTGRWWKQTREEVTSTGSSQKSIKDYWKGGQASSYLPNASNIMAIRNNSQATHINLATGDDVEGKFAVDKSHYKESFCAGHKKVGRRAVVLSDVAIIAVSCNPNTNMHSFDLISTQ